MSKILSNAREPVNSYTHAIGAVLSIIGTFALIISMVSSPDYTAQKLVSVIIFGISLIALYSASSIYHYVSGSPHTMVMLRKLDHAMIYVLIAGSYTPIMLNFLDPKKAVLFVTVMWSVAAVGILIKMFWMGAPRFLSTALYILMGWSILFDTTAVTSMPKGGFYLLLWGGISYTIGGVIYAIKKPNISKVFGFHELFHIFVLLGSLFHFFVVILYV